MRNRLDTRALVTTIALVAAAGCGQETPTEPPSATAAAALETAVTPMRGKPELNGPVTGERVFGNVAIEPAFDADTGELIYLLTPTMAPLPSHADAHAVSPLYLVEYPSGSTAAGDGHFNCEGVPGNCPDHDGLVAGVAVDAEPEVYGTDPTALPGHDHVVDGPGAPDFNIAWEVIEVVFTNAAAANTRLTTEDEIEAAIEAGDAIAIDLGFAFNCNVVPERLYWRGVPVEG